VKEEIPQVYNLSIIWQYYAKGKKLFSQFRLFINKLKNKNL